MNLVEIQLTEPLAQRRSLFWGLDQELVKTRCVLTLVHLGDATHTLEDVRPAPQHQPLQRPDSLQIAVSRRPKDPLSQVLHRPVDVLPVNDMPV
jgi:hypothetical protein